MINQRQANKEIMNPIEQNIDALAIDQKIGTQPVTVF